jgi:hypothetical protein
MPTGVMTDLDDEISPFIEHNNYTEFMKAPGDPYTAVSDLNGPLYFKPYDCYSD